MEGGSHCIRLERPSRLICAAPRGVTGSLSQTLTQVRNQAPSGAQAALRRFTMKRAGNGRARRLPGARLCSAQAREPVPVAIEREQRRRIDVAAPHAIDRGLVAPVRLAPVGDEQLATDVHRVELPRARWQTLDRARAAPPRDTPRRVRSSSAAPSPDRSQTPTARAARRRRIPAPGRRAARATTAAPPTRARRCAAPIPARCEHVTEMGGMLARRAQLDDLDRAMTAAAAPQRELPDGDLERGRLDGRRRRAWLGRGHLAGAATLLGAATGASAAAGPRHPGLHDLLRRAREGA